MSREDDITGLRRLLAAPHASDESPTGTSIYERNAFRNMLHQLETGGRTNLSANQHRWMLMVIERVFDEPTYVNDWSSGKVAQGVVGKTELPAVLRMPLPKKPPGRTP